LAGSDSSSTVTMSTARPPSFPPRSASASLNPLVMAVPSDAYVPVYGSMRPTLIFLSSARPEEARRVRASADMAKPQRNRRVMVNLLADEASPARGAGQESGHEGGTGR